MIRGFYRHFVPQNIAPLNASRIGVYDNNGNRVGSVRMSHSMSHTLGEKLYKVGVLSDVHVTYETATADFQRALTYLIEQDVDFICISGDLVGTGIDSQLSQYRSVVDGYAGGAPIYVSAGNHDAYDADWNLRPEAEVSASMQTWTGHPLYYTFEYGDDVYIFVGVCANTFSLAELQWLYNTLETNRNKRCFLFEHVFPWDGSGDIFDAYSFDMLDNTAGTVFESLMKHYKNVLWFHGHSHVKLDGQKYGDMANIDTLYGMYSLHVPSLAVPADGDADREYIYAESEGYIMDVYANHIVLRGRDFVAGKWIPLAQYCLDTTLQTVAAGTYKDSTGTIVT